nr:peptide ABC transporter substrate-binding protein [uncultured Caproiciproducens sp.]
MKKALAILVAATLMISSLTACGGGAKSSMGSGQPAVGTSEQTANICMETDPDTLDPSRSDDATKCAIVGEVQEGLVRMHDGKLEAAGAESWKVSKDGLTWTFTLRDNKYSDGSAVVAADYVNAVQRIFDPEVNCHNAGIFYCIKGGEEFNTGKGKKEDVGCKAPDDKTVIFSLKEALPYFEQLTNFINVSPIKPSATQGSKNSSYGATAEEMFYSGPFYIASWTRGSDIVMKKNQSYWDAKNVKLEQINVKLVQEEQTREQMFGQGELDILRNARSEYVNTLKTKIDSGDMILKEGPAPTSSYICFNNKDPNKIFTNVKVRKAFSLAIDRDAYVTNVIKKDKVAYGLIPYGLSNGDMIYRDKVLQPLEASKGQDPKDLLQEGLKELGLDPSKQITVTFLKSNSNNNVKVQSEFYQNQWESKLGVKVKIDAASDNSAFNNTVSKGLYQICQTGWGADYNDPMTFFQCYVTGDGNNPAFFSNARYDELVNACKTESDMNVRLTKFTEAEKILCDQDVGIAPLAFTFSKNLFSKRLQGAIINGSGGPIIEYKYASIVG